MELLKWWTNERRRTLLLVSLACILGEADEALLPGVYREISLALNVSPVGLGTLTLIRSLSQAICSPLAAYAAVHHNRASVIALGALLWALATYFTGFSTTYGQIAFTRALCGLGLALASPAIDSLVADSTEEHERGLAFGWLQAVENVGGIMGGFCAIILAGYPQIIGFSGWRFAFHLVGTLSVAVAVLNYLFAVDPRFATTQPQSRVKRDYWGSITGIREDVMEMIQEAKQVLQIRTFQILIAQGIPGNMPRRTFAFMPMWLELFGCSHEATAVLMGLFTAGNILGSVFGGRVGDILSFKYPSTGRIILAQISSGSGVFLAILLFVGLQDNPNAQVAYGIVLFIFGFMTCWEIPGAKNPIFAEIVPEKARTSIYSLDSCFNTITASFTTPLVGLVAEKIYGFRLRGDDVTANGVDGHNARSLSKAIYITYSTPAVLSCVIYTFLYHTYPRDRDQARLASKVEYAPLSEPHLQLEVLGSNDGGVVAVSDGDEFDAEFEVEVSEDRRHG